MLAGMKRKEEKVFPVKRLIHEMEDREGKGWRGSSTGHNQYAKP